MSPQLIAGTSIIDPASLPEPLYAAAPAPAPAANPALNKLSGDLSRILRPQAAYRWLLPQLAQITPDYVELTLRGALAGNHVQAWELFDLMQDSWPELSACCNELVEGVEKKTLVFEAYSQEGSPPTPKALDKKRFVSAALRNMRPDPAADENDFNGTLRDILSAWFVGTTVLEVYWDSLKNPGTLNTISIGGKEITSPRSTGWVHPVCYAWSMDGTLGLRAELNLIGQSTAPYRTEKKTSSPWRASGIPRDSYQGSGGSIWNTTAYEPRPSIVDDFPPNKFLIAIRKQKAGTALGGALLRVLAWWWCASNFSAEWLMNLAQLFGLPIRWANFDLNAPQETIDKICTMLQNMGTSGWAAFPTGTTLELKEAHNAGDHSPQAELLDRADRYARTVILGQTMTGSRRGMQGGGGPGFGGVEKDVKEDRMEAAGRFACSVINLQLIPYILTVMYGEDGDSEAPLARLLEKEEGGLPDAQRDTTLAQGGLKIGVNYMYEKYGIPVPAEGEETIGGAQAAPKSGNDDDNPNEENPPDGLDTRFSADELRSINFWKNEKVKALKPGESVVIDNPDSEHYINYCTCGGLISQCRCDGPNRKTTVTRDGCRKCKEGTHCALHGRDHSDTATAKLADNVLEKLTGIEARWLGDVKPFFRELLAKAQDKSVSDADLVKAIEKAQRQIPELFHKLDTKALADAMEHTMSAAAVNGAVRGFMKRKSGTRAPEPVVAGGAHA